MQLDSEHLLPAALLAAAEHDVRGLLVTLRGGADILRGQLDDSPLGEVAAAVARAGEQLSVVLLDLVAAAGELVDGGLVDDTVDVGALLSELASGLGVEDVLVQSDEPLVVVGSPVAVRHVLVNLLENAVAACGAGPVSVRLGPSGPRHLEVMIRNPLAAKPAAATTVTPILHTTRGRGLRIVEVLAAATGMDHAAGGVGGHYIARVQIPRRLWHPSLMQPKESSAPGEVTVLDQAVRVAGGEQSG